jgi:hypothetical protein
LDGAEFMTGDSRGALGEDGALGGVCESVEGFGIED